MSFWSPNLPSDTQLSSMNPVHSHTEISNNGWGHQATIRRDQALQVMVDDLNSWGLYSLDGAEEPESLVSMYNLSTRYRTVHEKGTYHSYTDDALQRSWCAFIRRRNASRLKESIFTYWIERCEDTHGSHDIGDLRRSVCRLTRDELRMCYIHVREWYPYCNMVRPRPIQQKWDDLVCARGMPQHVQSWISRYERSISSLQVSAPRRTR